jgi:hypothetical protein
MVTRQVVSVGHATDATTPPKVTVINPVALTRFVPCNAMVCPTELWEGESAVSRGAPAGVGAEGTVGGIVDRLVGGPAVVGGAAVVAGAVALGPWSLAG